RAVAVSELPLRDARRALPVARGPLHGHQARARALRVALHGRLAAGELGRAVCGGEHRRDLGHHPAGRVLHALRLDVDRRRDRLDAPRPAAQAANARSPLERAAASRNGPVSALAVLAGREVRLRAAPAEPDPFGLAAARSSYPGRDLFSDSWERFA